MILDEEYYLNTDVCYIAKNLLGKLLITCFDGQYTSGIIVETEAYRGPDDRASHSFNNRLTPRNTIMYHRGGCAYVYLCYGFHSLFNVVTAPEHHAHAVLIRALEPVEGIEVMRERRSLNQVNNIITKGPGSLSLAMGINKSHNSLRLYNQKSPIQIHNQSTNYLESEIGTSARIGVESSGDSAHWPWRYFIKSSPFVSVHKKSIL